MPSNDLKFTGNCLLGSRPILFFNNDFNTYLNRKLEKNLWVDAMNVGKNHPKSQPFIDKVMSFNYDRGNLFIRNHQINKKDTKGH